MSLFDEVVAWKGDDFLGHEKKGLWELFDLADYLEERIQNNEISKGFVYSLLEMWKETFGKFDSDLVQIEKRRQMEHKYVPRLKYKLARTFSENKDKIKHYEGKLKPNMPWIRIPVSLVSLRMR